MTYIEKLYTVEEIGANLKRSPETTHKWRRAGKIKAIKLPSGRYAFSENELGRILQGER